MKLEADELCTTMVTEKLDRSERPAIRLSSTEAGLNLYYFITREEAHDLVSSIVDMFGYDA